ncbi:hypothetical protein AGMMS49938_05840 [Fibrobacterales bacterium]|nr:hypothetical protein AGMMS49938_05840 [Fibrobacterales bacterium]
MKYRVEEAIDRMERQTFLNMPLRKAVLLFSVAFFVAVVAVSVVSYYFAIRKTLEDSIAGELNRIVETRKIELSAELDKEISVTRILADSPVLRAYFAEPENDVYRQSAFNVFQSYKQYLQDEMLSWINVKDMAYFVNGQFMENYDSANPNHSWFFRTLHDENPPNLEVDFDYLSRLTYDFYINFPVYANENGVQKALGVICNRISLTQFINSLNLPPNVYIFDKNGIIVGAADQKLAKEKKTLADLFKDDSHEILLQAMNAKSNSIEELSLNDFRYAVANTDYLNLYIVAKDSVGLNRILYEPTTFVFLSLLVLMLIVFVIFNRFIFSVLNPMSKKMQVYMESSLVDELTKLPNRRFFNTRMQDEWNRAVRAKAVISFLMMDLDKFKNYNDTHGHLEGDLLLQQTAAVLSSCANRLSDIAARIGGEEFCILLPNTDVQGAAKLAESIRDAMERTHKVTISIGIASIVPNLEYHNIRDFMNMADRNLYKAKNAGRNRVVW